MLRKEKTLSEMTRFFLTKEMLDSCLHRIRWVRGREEPSAVVSDTGHRISLGKSSLGKLECELD